MIIRLSYTKCCSRKEFSEFTTSLRWEVLFSHTVNLPRYNLNCNFLQYLQVVSAIPKRLLKKEKQNLDPKFTFLQDNAFFSAVIHNKSESSENEEQRFILVIHKQGEFRTQGTYIMGSWLAVQRYRTELLLLKPKNL